MIVPRYWAEARLQRREPGRQVTVRRFGWSDLDQQDAERLAQLRAAEALARIWLGEALPRREHKVPYNGAEGLPIREEILAEHGDAVITRNSYGAACLNTPDVLFADVDFHAPPMSVLLHLAGVLATIGIGLAVRAGGMLIVSMAVLVFLVHPVVVALLQRWRVTRQGGAEAVARRRVLAFVQQHPDWRLRVYRTPHGLRLLAMHATFAPDSAAVAAFFAAIGADPVYVRMCQRQQCFRARVSPKPWRIGIEGRMRPRPGIWPVSAERLPDRQRWVGQYERVAAAFASCRYVETVGSATVDAKAEAVRALHDEWSRAGSQLPIA